MSTGGSAAGKRLGMNAKSEAQYGAGPKRSGMGNFTGNEVHFERPQEEKNQSQTMPSAMAKARTTAAQAQKTSGYGSMDMAK